MVVKTGFVEKCDKFMAFCFFALIYFIPISIALSETFINLALVAYFIKRIAIFISKIKSSDFDWKGLPVHKKAWVFLKHLKPIENWLNGPIALVLFFSVVSVIFSQNFSLSVSGFFGKTLQNAFIYFTFIECINTKKRLKIFLFAFFASVTLICTNGLFQYYGGKGFIHGRLFEGQVSSSLRQANDFGSYLLIVTPVLFCLSVFILNGLKEQISKERSGFAFFSSPITKIVILCVFLLSLACLGLTYSRGAWLSFALSLFLVSIKSRKRLLLAMVFLLLFIVLFGPGMMQNRNDLNSFHHFIVNNNRLLYWEGAFALIKDYPVWGTGLNAYSFVRSQYEIDWGGYPHNCYLQMLAEVGIFGFLAFIGMLFVFFRNATRSIRKIRENSLRVLFIGFLVGFAAFVFHAFWDTTFYSVQLASLMWVTMGLIFSIFNISGKEMAA